MNNMKSKETTKLLRDLALAIGDFIKYWGFRKIHGAIWTQLYLSQEPLSCAQLTQMLNFSKALISPALSELVEFGLIQLLESSNEKTKMSKTTENIDDVIKNILRNRESKIIQNISNKFEKIIKNNDKFKDTDLEKLNNIGDMIYSVKIMLNFIISLDNILSIKEI